MKPHEAIGYTLLHSSAITSVVSNRVFYGLRPQSPSSSVLTALPAINFYELAGGREIWGTGIKTVSINCRAFTAQTAITLASAVTKLFNGTSGTGITGTENGFNIARVHMKADGGLIPESDTGVYNAPVDILIVYPLDTVS